MNRIVIGALAGIGIAGMATAPGAYAAPVVDRGRDQSTSPIA